jgi:hypothetical protein
MKDKAALLGANDTTNTLTEITFMIVITLRCYHLLQTPGTV